MRSAPGRVYIWNSFQIASNYVRKLILINFLINTSRPGESETRWVAPLGVSVSYVCNKYLEFRSVWCENMNGNNQQSFKIATSLPSVILCFEHLRRIQSSFCHRMQNEPNAVFFGFRCCSNWFAAALMFLFTNFIRTAAAASNSISMFHWTVLWCAHSWELRYVQNAENTKIKKNCKNLFYASCSYSTTVSPFTWRVKTIPEQIRQKYILIFNKYFITGMMLCTTAAYCVAVNDGRRTTEDVMPARHYLSFSVCLLSCPWNSSDAFVSVPKTKFIFIQFIHMYFRSIRMSERRTANMRHWLFGARNSGRKYGRFRNGPFRTIFHSESHSISVSSCVRNGIYNVFAERPASNNNDMSSVSSFSSSFASLFFCQ